MKKIIFFVTSLNSGGIENYLLRFLRRYEDEIKATVYCKGGEFGELEEQYENIRSVKLIKNKLGCSLSSLSHIKLRNYLFKEKFDVVCDFTGNFAGPVLKEASRAGVNNRIAFYRGSTNRFKETMLKKMYNLYANFLVKKYATSILSNSKAAFNFFFNKKDDRFQVIYNGVSHSDFFVKETKTQIRQEFNIPDDAYVIGHTGRVHFSKNHTILVAIAEILCSKYQNVHFIFCGKNTETLKDKIKITIRDRVHLLGYRSDIPRVLKSFDVFLFPSITEGQPNALIEAMLSGLPIVASNIEPIKETVPPTHWHYLFSPMDATVFINAIEELYHGEKIQPQLKSWATVNFNPDILFEKFYKVLIK